MQRAIIRSRLLPIPNTISLVGSCGVAAQHIALWDEAGDKTPIGAEQQYRV